MNPRVRLHVDGEIVAAPRGARLVEVLRSAGHRIAAHCHHALLEGRRDCGLCAVRVNGSPASACAVRVEGGLVVEVAGCADRREADLQRILAGHDAGCATCRADGDCDLQGLLRGAGRVAGSSPEPRSPALVPLGPDLAVDDARCTGCGICVALAQELFAEEGLVAEETAAGPRPRARAELAGIAGYHENFVAICPTQALTRTGVSSTSASVAPPRDWDRRARETICDGCATGCAIEIRSGREGRGGSRPRRALVRARAEAEVNAGWLCDRARAGVEARRDAPRSSPMVKGRSATHREALAAAARHLGRAHRRGSGAILVTTTHDLSNEEAWLLRRFLHEVLGEERLLLGPARAEGPADDFLRDADRHANRRGTLLLLGDAVAPDPIGAAAAAEVWLRVGTTETSALEPEMRDALAAIPLRLAIATEPAETPELGAAVWLPGRDGAGSTGTRVNRQSRVQAFRAAPDARGPSLITTLFEIASAMGASLGAARSATALFAEICRHHPRFRAVDVSAVGNIDEERTERSGEVGA